MKGIDYKIAKTRDGLEISGHSGHCETYALNDPCCNVSQKFLPQIEVMIILIP